MADEQRALRDARAFERFWDALVSGRDPRRPDALNPETADAARRLHALGNPQPVDRAFEERLLEEIMNGTSLSAGTIPLRPTLAPNRNGASHGWSRPMPVQPRRAVGPLHTALNYAVTAALFVSVLALIFYVLQNGNSAIPPVQETATAVATPVATPDPHVWPGFGGNAARTRVVPGPGPQNPPGVLWTYPPAGATNLFASVDRGAVADDVLYLPTDTGNLVAVDASSGTEVWRKEGYGGTVVVDGDGLITYANPTADAADLVRLRRADGEVVWTAEVGAIVPAWNPVIADGVGYVPSGNDFIAFDPATGATIWRTSLAVPASRGAAVADGLAVFGDQNGTVQGFTTADGDAVWSFETGLTLIAHPSIANGMAYFTGTGGTEEAFYALDLATGELGWRFVSPDGSAFRGAAIDATAAYMTTENGTLYALDAATGALRWRFETGPALAASPAVVGGTLYFCAESGFAYALDAMTGTELWRLPLDAGAASGAVVVDGAFYATTGTGTTYAIGSAEQAPPLASPTAAPSPSPIATGSSTAQVVWSATGSATDRLEYPLSVRLSPGGTLWVPDLSGRFFIFDLDGNLLETWGSRGHGPGQFAFTDSAVEIGSITFLPDGSFYVVDSLNRRIQRFDRDRTYLGEWGSRGRGDGQFLVPAYLVVAPDGTLLVSDLERGDVQRFDASGTYLGKIDGIGSPEGALQATGGMAFDAAGNLYVAEYSANRVRIIDPTGTSAGLLGEGGPDHGGFSGPIEVAIDGSGYVYVVDQFNKVIKVFDGDGRFVFEWGGPGSGEGELRGPEGIALNRGGIVYVADWRGNRLLKFKITGPLPAPAASPVA